MEREKTTDACDEVIFEVDVYLSKALSQSLYLFHYPTNNKCFAAEDDLEYLSARIKPKQKKLEMEIAINTHSGSYDKSRGEQMAYNVDGQNPRGGEPYFQSSRMDKYMLTGTKADKSTESFAVGYMKDGKLHVTPLHTVMELKPGFVHMDKMDNASKKAQNPDEEETEEEAVAVTVRFEGPNAEKDRKLRQKSFQYIQLKNANEKWIDVSIHTMGTSLSQSECQKLICSEESQELQEENIAIDYVKKLLPECYRLCGFSQDEVKEINDPSKTIQLTDHMKLLLVNAHVLTYSMLVEKLTSNEFDIMTRIPRFAVLVRGCWAVKSDLLYAENTVSSYSGMSAKLLINARDYVLWLFTKSPFITYREVLKVIYIPDADFKSIVAPMAVKADKCWQFKFDLDEEFLKNHPNVEQSQELKWSSRYANLVKELRVRESESESPKSTASSRPRHKRISRSSISEGDESDSASAKDGKTKRQQVAKKRQPLSPSKAASFGSYLECSQAAKSELGELVGEALKSQYCMTLSEVKGVVIESPLYSLVAREDFEKVLDEVLSEFGAQKLKNKWPQNTVPETLYAFAKFGNRLDRYRTALLELYSTTARARTNLFVKKIEDEMREIVSEADTRQIFEEYCVYKSGFYYLKGTISPDPVL